MSLKVSFLGQPSTRHTWSGECSVIRLFQSYILCGFRPLLVELFPVLFQSGDKRVVLGVHAHRTDIPPHKGGMVVND